MPKAVIDCNNFFVSCEQIFNPKLVGVPTVVLSNNDGCVVARSIEAKIIGIPMGSPYFKIRNELERAGVNICSSNFELYGDISNRVMNTLNKYTQSIESYSIDESFFELDFLNYQSLIDHGQEIRTEILKGVGMSTTIGIAASKTLAKAAAEYSKNEQKKALISLIKHVYGVEKEYLYTLTPAQWKNLIKYRKKLKTNNNGVISLFDNPHKDQILKEIEIGDVWGIGRQSSKKLINLMNIKTAYDFTLASDEVVKKNLNILGLKTKKELEGHSMIDVETDLIDGHKEVRKSILSSRSFGKKTNDKRQISIALSNHIENASKKLIKQRSVTRFLTVYLMTSRHNNNESEKHFGKETVTLEHATNSPYKLNHLAQKALDRMFQPGYLYYKVGVSLSSFENDNYTSRGLNQDLFTPDTLIQQQKGSVDTERSLNDAVSKVNDHLKKKNPNQYTGSKLKLASSVTIKKNDWQMKKEMRSNRFTTRWDEILTVK